MREIKLLLEEEEIMLMRMQARMTALIVPDMDELVDAYIRKVLEATDDLNPELKKEIGRMQRALKRIKETAEYNEFIRHMKQLEILLVKEMEKGDTP